jgi:hypothetical protein
MGMASTGIPKTCFPGFVAMLEIHAAWLASKIKGLHAVIYEEEENGIDIEILPRHSSERIPHF